MSLKVTREENQKQEQLHLNDKKQLMDQLHLKDVQYQDILRQAKLNHAEEVEKCRQDFEEKVREMEKRYSERYINLRSEFQLRLKTVLKKKKKKKLGT